jgi:hypothetical protein
MRWWWEDGERHCLDRRKSALRCEMEEFERGEPKGRTPEEPAHHDAKAQSLTEASR